MSPEKQKEKDELIAIFDQPGNEELYQAIKKRLRIELRARGYANQGAVTCHLEPDVDLRTMEHDWHLR